MRVDEALSLFKGIVLGLNFAHQRGFIHRDLTPNNVLLEVQTRDDRVCPRINDFGLVKVRGVANQTQVGSRMGTPAYVAPEQLRDAASVDLRADLFSLGVILVEMLCGFRPFKGINIADVVEAHHGPPKLVGMPNRYRNLAQALLERNPANRPRGCEIVLKELDDISEHVSLRESALNETLKHFHHFQDDESYTQTDGGSITRTQSVAIPPNNLSRSRDGFVGREDEMQTLQTLLLSGQRLISLVGAAGVGKSRLAREIGWALRLQRPGGVWLCPLSDAHTHEEILSTVTAKLGVPFPKSSHWDKQLEEAIPGLGPTQLIPANFEPPTP